MRPQLKSVKPQDSYKLELCYANGERRVFDATLLFRSALNQPLKNKSIFDTVKVVGCGIEWCNGIDVCPDELYSNSEKIN